MLHTIHHSSKLILGMHPANERCRYKVTPSGNRVTLPPPRNHHALPILLSTHVRICCLWLCIDRSLSTYDGSQFMARTGFDLMLSGPFCYCLVHWFVVERGLIYIITVVWCHDMEILSQLLSLCEGNPQGQFCSCSMHWFVDAVKWNSLDL